MDNFSKIKKEIDLEGKTVEEIREMLGGTKVHAIAVQKGGTGKTTASSDIAYTLAKKGFKVLLIDSDPQASLSNLCNINTDDDEILGLQDIYKYVIDKFENEDNDIDLEDIKPVWVGKRPTFIQPVRDSGKFINKEVEFGFDFIPANLILADYEILLSRIDMGGFILYSVVREIVDKMDYDFILIDTCPGLNPIAYNAIAASKDGIIIPVNLENMTIKGAKNLIGVTTNIQQLMYQSEIIHKGILGIIKNQYAPRLKIQQKYSDIVETFFPIPCFETSIPNKTSCDIAHDRGRVYSEYDPKIGHIFDKLTEEIIKLDIYRSSETELVLVDEIGEEVWDKVNENKIGKDE